MKARLNLKKRRCPKCLGLLEWTAPKGKAPRRPEDMTACRKHMTCAWVGPFFETMPLVIANAAHSEPDHYRRFIGILSHALNVQIDGTRALKDFEVYLQNHEYADPDSRGHRDIQRYIQRFGQLQVFIQLIDAMGLTLQRDELIRREMGYLFPEAPRRIVK